MSRVIRSHEQNAKRRRKWTLISIAVFILTGAALYDIAWFAARPGVQISDIAVFGNEVIASEDVKTETRKIISGKYFYLIPRTNIFFYPKNSIQIGLLEKFPQAREVSISLDKKTLLVSVSEREPVALWCGADRFLPAPQKACYYLDENAFIFDEAPVFSGDAYFEFYKKGDMEKDTAIGKTFLEKTAFENILELHELIETYRQSVPNVVLSEDGSGEFGTSAGCVIRFNVDQEFEALASNMDAVFHSYKWNDSLGVKQNENVCERLEYVDFRFGNKIYYREKGKESSPINNSMLDMPPPESTLLEMTASGAETATGTNA